MENKNITILRKVVYSDFKKAFLFKFVIMDRLAEMSEQRRIIEEKKQEILRKISEKRRKKEVEGLSTTTNIVTSSNKR